MNRSNSEPIETPGEELPLIAIMGRPNVGKSTLFNRLTGGRRAIVGDEPGITRDRIYGQAEWRGRRFRVVDTGGIIPDEKDVIPANILRQARMAAAESVLVLLVVDARAGITPMDQELVELARRTRKHVFIAANKADAMRLEADAFEFGRWGFDVFPISAEHGNGVGELLDAALKLIPEAEHPASEEAGEPVNGEEAKQASSAVRIAIIGRPNVGKSSLVNKLTGEERVIVSSIPGTTRDAVDTEIVRDGKRFTLIDTAGIRRKGKTGLVAEKIAVVMARKHLERADVAILLIDAVEGPTALDATIGGYADEAGASLVIAVNKWDAIERTEESAKKCEERIREMMKFASYAPVVFISALTGHNVEKLVEAARRADLERGKRVTTAELNRFFERNLLQPRATIPSRHPSRVLYMTQAGTRPPTFVLFTSGRTPRSQLHFSYERYIVNRLREEFGFYGTPIRIKQRGKKPRAKQ